MGPLSRRPSLLHAWAWVCWEARRSGRAFRRRLGAAGVLVILCLAIALAAWRVEERQVAVADDLLSRLFEPSTLTAPPMPASADGSRQRAKLFDQQLLPHADIPTALQDLFNLAEDEQLVIARGDYRPQLDTQGGFLRYRMSLPVKGEARAVLRFLHKALRTQKALALESVQFKREHAGASEVEARLQLALLVQLPPRVAGVAP